LEFGTPTPKSPEGATKGAFKDKGFRGEAVQKPPSGGWGVVLKKTPFRGKGVLQRV